MRCIGPAGRYAADTFSRGGRARPTGRPRSPPSGWPNLRHRTVLTSASSLGGRPRPGSAIDSRRRNILIIPGTTARPWLAASNPERCDEVAIRRLGRAFGPRPAASITCFHFGGRRDQLPDDSAPAAMLRCGLWPRRLNTTRQPCSHSLARRSFRSGRGCRFASNRRRHSLSGKATTRLTIAVAARLRRRLR